MSEDSPSYSSPSPGEGSILPACCLACGSPAIHSLAHRRQPTLACLAYLREQIGTLQGEVLAQRLKLAARPEPRITTDADAAGGLSMREVIQPIFPGYVPWEHQPCHHCGSPGHHLTIHDPPALECINVLREQVAQAKQPITTYAQLSAATGIPVARLERLRVFAPEADPAVCCETLAYDVQLHCILAAGHTGAHFGWRR